MKHRFALVSVLSVLAVNTLLIASTYAAGQATNDGAAKASQQQLSRVRHGDISDAIRQQPDSPSQRQWASGSYQPLSAVASLSAARSRATRQPLAK